MSQFFPPHTDRMELQRSILQFKENLSTILNLTLKLKPNSDLNDPVLAEAVMISDEIKSSQVLSELATFKQEKGQYTLISSPKSSYKSMEGAELGRSHLPHELIATLSFNPIPNESSLNPNPNPNPTPSRAQQQEESLINTNPIIVETSITQPQPQPQQKDQTPPTQSTSSNQPPPPPTPQKQEPKTSSAFAETMEELSQFKAYQEFEKIAKQDLIQNLTKTIEFKESMDPQTADYTYQIVTDKGDILGEHTGTKKRAKTIAAIKACLNPDILPLVTPLKYHYWVETYFPNKQIEISKDEDAVKDEHVFFDARNRLYAIYNKVWNVVPQYDFTQDEDLNFHCKLSVGGVVRTEGMGKSKKIAGNDAAYKLLKSEKLLYKYNDV